MPDREQWASIELRFVVEGEGNPPTYLVRVPLYTADDVGEAIDRAKKGLLNGFAKDAAYRLSRSGAVA